MPANVIVPPFTAPTTTSVGATVTTAFPFDFPFWESADILVYKDNVLQSSGLYTVAGVALQDGDVVEGGYGGGTVTFTTGVSNCTIKIDRMVVGDRETQFSRSTPLDMRALNGDLNRLTARQQDLDRLFDRAITVDYGTTPPDAQDIVDAANLAAGKQPLDADLTAIAALTSAANKVPYATGSATWALADFTAAGRALVDDADATAQRATLGLTIGTNVQAYDADLTTWAGITPGTGVATALAVNVGSAGAFTTFNGAGGTPSSLTLTNATGLPVAGITSSTSTALGVGSLELGHATDTTLARSSAGNMTIEGNLVYRAGGTDVPITDGGTGSSTAADARTALAVVGLTDLAASTGAALVGSIVTGTGATARTVQAKLRDIVSVKDFGAVGDGSTDDYTAFNNALTAASGGCVIVPFSATSYILGSTLAIPANTKLRFEAGRRQLISKTHTGSMYTMGAGCEVEGGNHRGGTSGAAAGKCFVFSGTNGGQRLSNFLANTYFNDTILDFAVAAGSQCVISDCIIGRADASGDDGKSAVVIEDTYTATAYPRHFVNVETGGTASFTTGGCNALHIVGGYIGPMTFSANSRGVEMSATRLGNQSALTVRGANHVLNAGFNPQITIASGTTAIDLRGYYNTGRPLDSSGSGTNNICFPKTGAVPVLRSDTTALTLIGAGGDLSRSDAIYRWYLEIACSLTGSSSPGGLGSGFLNIELPTGALPSGTQFIGPVLECNYIDSGAVARVAQIRAVIVNTGRISLQDVNGNSLTSARSPGAVESWTLTGIRGAVIYGA